VRHHHLSLEYLTGVVSVCPFSIESGLLSYILCLSFTDLKAEEQGANLMVKDRGRGSPDYTFTSTFNLADVRGKPVQVCGFDRWLPHVPPG